MGFALPCFNLILTTLALAELTIPEKELGNLQLDRLQEEAELVDLLTLPEECQRLVGFYWLHLLHHCSWPFHCRDIFHAS